MAPVRALLILSTVWLVSACQPETRSETRAEAEPWYTTGAPLPGIDTLETLYLGLIYKGSTWTADESPEQATLQRQHLANIDRLAGLGLMVLAGPFWRPGEEPDLRGLFVYRVPSVDSARVLADTDPAVAAGRLKVDLYPWVTSAMLGYDADYQMRSYVAAVLRRSNEPAGADTRTIAELIATWPETADVPNLSLYGVCPDPDTAAGTPTALLIFDSDSVQVVRSSLDTLFSWAGSGLSVQVISWYGPSGLHL